MRFWSLLIAAWLPVLQVLLVGLLGALLLSSRFDVLTSDARRNIGKIVYIVFVPSLVFSSLNKSAPAKDPLVEILEELWSPPSIAVLVGFIVGAVDNMKSLFTEEGSPLRVIQDLTKLLGDATIPCTVLILGGNLTKGIGKTMIGPIMVISIIVIRYVILPACGIGIVAIATKLGFLPRSPQYRYVLLLQSTVPPAMSIGTTAQLYDVGEEECSIIFLRTHLVAALALTLWSTVFMSLVL